MRRGSFVAIVAHTPGEQARVTAAELGLRLDEMGTWWRTATFPDLQVWRSEAGRLDAATLPCGAGVVLGDLFATPGAHALSPLRPAAPAPKDDAELARTLTQAHWGAYVAFLAGKERRPPAVYRDPSGDLEASVWRLDADITVVASDPFALPGWLRPPHLRMDWTSIAAQVADQTAVRLESMFEGLSYVAPGVLERLGPSRSATRIWRPADFVTRRGRDLTDAASELVEVVDCATAAMSGVHSTLLLELSGGLDSAIVAGALGHTDLAPRVAQWVNRFGDRPEGDERIYAGAVTDRLGVDLTAIAKPQCPISLDMIAALADAQRPALNGADPIRDGDMAERLTRTGATGILSGQGGDAIFFQMPSALVVSDALRRDGLGVLASPLLGRIARRKRAPAWSVLGEAWRAYRGDLALPSALTSLLSDEVRADNARRLDPWLEDTEHLPPGKRLQIRTLSGSQVHRADCRRRRVGDLLYPLMSQPVVELCLSIATPDLAGEEYDRAFARAAFANRIPDRIRTRRGKGNLGSYFARWIAGSADTLRPFLLDGCLCAAGVLDRGRVERALDPQQLIWAPEPGDLMAAAVTEAWVRHWQGRIPDSSTAGRDRLMAHRRDFGRGIRTPGTTGREHFPGSK